MSNSASNEWPDPTYHIGQREHLHALGVITASFNQLEFVLFLFFMDYLKLQPKLAQRLFVQIANNVRCELLIDAVELEETDAQIRGRALHFLKAFQILADNRNFLSHSQTIMNDPNQPHLTFGKGSKRQPDVWSFAHLTLPEIRQVADDIWTYWKFGSELRAWMVTRATGGVMTFSDGQTITHTLPETPPLPDKLKHAPHGIPQ
jgi:hypothetical protein